MHQVEYTSRWDWIVRRRAVHKCRAELPDISIRDGSGPAWGLECHFATVSVVAVGRGVSDRYTNTPVSV